MFHINFILIKKRRAKFTGNFCLTYLIYDKGKVTYRKYLQDPKVFSLSCNSFYYVRLYIIKELQLNENQTLITNFKQA